VRAAKAGTPIQPPLDSSRKSFCDKNLLFEITHLLPSGAKMADRPDDGARVANVCADCSKARPMSRSSCKTVTDGHLVSSASPCLKSRIHRSCLLINVCRVNEVPSPPWGRRWPLGRMRGLSWIESVQNGPFLRPSPPIFFSRTLPCTTTLHLQKIGGEGAT
jgi:hypothetical protein